VASVQTIPFLSLEPQHAAIDEAMRETFSAVYRRGAFILGNEVEQFEAEYAQFSGVPYCIGVGSGLDALTLSLLVSGVSAGDEVIVPAHTYLATWLAIIRVGAVPVPVDADVATFNIDPSRINEKINEKTRAILPVHLYGQPCDMTMLDEISRQFNISVIEDNAQGHGGRWREKRTGSFGTVNATSFYPTKNLGCLGDGGAITLFDEEKAWRLKRLRNYGLKEKNVLAEKGFNSRLDELQAAFLRVKLRQLDRWNAERNELAKHYLTGLHQVGDLILPLSHKEVFHVYHLFVVRTAYRDDLRMFLKENGIETMIHYPIPPHLQDAFKGCGFRRGDFPIAERIAETALSLPLWPGMNVEMVERICRAISKFFSITA
jgi:dTDP-4-amino-4,6-dideoxygalactose transaminase